MPPRYFPAFTTPVRGHRFAGRPPGDVRLEGLDAVELVREPHNPSDPRAVAVWGTSASVRWRIGYLERAVARRLAPRLDAGEVLEATPAGWLPEPGGRWSRPAVRVAAGTGASGAEHGLHGQQGIGRQHPFDDRVVEPA